jgi:hypothetical protein
MTNKKNIKHELNRMAFNADLSKKKEVEIQQACLMSK